MNGFLRSVQDQEVPSGSAVLWWLGQMGLLIKMGSTVLCVDYFASETAERQVIISTTTRGGPGQKDARRQSLFFLRFTGRKCLPTGLRKTEVSA